MIVRSWFAAFLLWVSSMGAAFLSAQTAIDLRTQSKGVDFSGASATIPYKTGPSLPASCGVGEAFFDLSANPGSNLFLCTATDTWANIVSGGAGGGTVTGPESSTQYGVVIYGDTSGGTVTEAAGCRYSTLFGRGVISCDGGFEAGDGSYQGGLITRETVANGGTYEWAFFGPADQAADRCIVFPDQQPNAGDVLRATVTTADVTLVDKFWSGCRVMAWESLGNQDFDWTGAHDFGNGVVEIPNGATLPATCNVGEQFMDTDAPSGQRHYLCEAANSWVLQGDGGGAGGAALITGVGQAMFIPPYLASIENHQTGLFYTAGHCYCEKFLLPVDMAVSAIQIEIVTAATSNTTGLAAAIYDSSGAYVAKASTQTGLNVTGFRELPISATLGAGSYTLCMSTDSVTIRLRSVPYTATTSSWLNGLESTANLRVYSTLSGVATGSGSVILMPDTVPTPSTDIDTRLFVFGLLP